MTAPVKGSRSTSPALRGWSPSTSSTSASSRARTGGRDDSSDSVQVSVPEVVSWPARIIVRTSSRTSTSLSAEPSWSRAARSRSSRSGVSGRDRSARRSATISPTIPSRVLAGPATPGARRNHAQLMRRGAAPARTASGSAARPTCPSASSMRCADPPSAAPNNDEPTTSNVTDRIWAAPSTRHSRVPQLASNRSVAARMSAANPVTCRRANTGCTIRRCRSQTSPSLVTRPSPRNACRGRWVTDLT